MENDIKINLKILRNSWVQFELFLCLINSTIFLNSSKKLIQKFIQSIKNRIFPVFENFGMNNKNGWYVNVSVLAGNYVDEAVRQRAVECGTLILHFYYNKLRKLDDKGWFRAVWNLKREILNFKNFKSHIKLVKISEFQTFFHCNFKLKNLQILTTEIQLQISYSHCKMFIEKQQKKLFWLSIFYVFSKKLLLKCYKFSFSLVFCKTFNFHSFKFFSVLFKTTGYWLHSRKLNPIVK